MEEGSQATDAAEDVGPLVEPIPSQMFSGFDGSLSGPNYAVWIGCGLSAVMVAALVMTMSSRPPEPATLVLVTKPADVAISLDGKSVGGHSPFKLEHLSPDVEHTVELRKAGFITQIHHIELATGELKRLPRVTLDELPVDRGLALGATRTQASDAKTAVSPPPP